MRIGELRVEGGAGEEGREGHGGRQGVCIRAEVMSTSPAQGGRDWKRA